MIPILAGAMMNAVGAVTPSMPLTVTFPAGATSAAMGTGDSILVTYTWDGGAQEGDEISMQVYKVGNAPTQWFTESFAATTAATNSSAFSSADSGYDGAGTYKFFAVMLLSGAPVEWSAEITLTIS